MNGKKKYFAIVIVIVLLIVGFLTFQNFKTVSLEKDLLENVNFSEVKANTLITSNDKIHFVKKSSSDELLDVLKEIKLKKQSNVVANEFTSISFSGSGGSFKIFIYDNQHMSIPSEDVSTIYKITEKDDYNKLLKIIQKYK